MSSSYSPLVITCVRSIDTYSNDDVITVKPHLTSAFEQLYSVTHKVGVDHSPEEYQIRTNTSMSGEGLLNYMNSLLDLLYYDEDPFECIQFDIPSLPSMLVKPHNLDLVKERVYATIGALVNSTMSWPLNNHIRNSASQPRESSTGQTASETKSNRHKQHKQHKHKNHKSHKSHPYTCSSASTHPEHTRQSREHLFFDEDNNISSYYYDI
jgi:hypothetical protein